MSGQKITGTGKIASTDYKYVKWVGTTKGGQALTIELDDAINVGNMEWALKEKDEVVSEVTFEATYNDTALAAGTLTEPWNITYADGVTAGNGEIILGLGKVYIGAAKASAACIGLTRGGGKFVREISSREIAADGDPGAVKDRIAIDGVRAKITFSALQILTKLTDLYAGLNSAAAT